MKTRALALALLVASCSPPPAAPVESTATVQITSVPAGLKVKFDGKELEGVTPLELRAVKALERHEVEVLMPGKDSWKKAIAPPAGAKLVLKAEFKQDAPATVEQPAPPAPAAGTDAGAAPAPAPAPAEAGDGGAPAAVPAPAPAPVAADSDGGTVPPAPTGPVNDGGNIDPLHATWPVKEIQIDADKSFVWVPEAGGVVVTNLSPKKSYRISAEGGASTRKGAKPAAFARYYLEGEQLNAEDALGTITSKGKTIKGAKKMWIFDFDDDASDNTGKVRVQIQESQYVPPQYVTWDATKKENLVFPDKEKLFTLDGLNPLRTYTFLPFNRSVMVREAPFGALTTVVCRLENEGVPARFEVFPVKGTRQTFSEAKSISCFYMDSSPEPNSGHSIFSFNNAP